jgi:hypothetical protein
MLVDYFPKTIAFCLLLRRGVKFTAGKSPTLGGMGASSGVKKLISFVNFLIINVDYF